jgi:hypothetical protein
MSDQTLSDERTRTTKLGSNRRGEVAELAFMRKAASLGLGVAKPWGESDRYDVIVCFENTFWRVQIKSVLDKSPSRDHYRVQTADSRKHTYSRKDIDFLVAYIFAEDLWYVLPAHIVENKKSVCLSPGYKRSSVEKYREAWDQFRTCGGSKIAPDCSACVFVQVWQGSPETSLEPSPAADAEACVAETTSERIIKT